MLATSEEGGGARCQTRAKAGGWGDKLPVLRTSEYVSGKNILAGIKT